MRFEKKSAPLVAGDLDRLATEIEVERKQRTVAETPARGDGCGEYDVEVAPLMSALFFCHW